MSRLYYTHVASPIGHLLVAGTETTLHFLSFPTGHKAFGPDPNWQQADVLFQNVRQQLNAYFAGELRCFDLSLRLSGTAFQNSVWNRLSGIPFGETRTYGQIATQLDRPKACRAVGAANGSTHLPIVFACHRVIGASGSLTGFGGGLPTKEFLLRHEGVLE